MNIAVNIFLCVLLYCLIYILIKLYEKWNIIKFYINHNGPRYFPYFGNSVFSGNNTLATYLKLRNEYGMPYTLWIYNDLYYATDNPNEIKIILNHPECFNKATFYSEVIQSCLFDGFAFLTLSEIDKWKLYRRFAAKSMRPTMWKDFLPVFHEYSQRLNRSFKKSKQFTNFDDFFASLNNIVFQTFMVNFLGMENYQMKDIDNFTTNIQNLLAVLGKRTTFQRIIPDYIWKYHTENGRNVCNIINNVRKQIYEIIQMKRKIYKKDINSDTINDKKFLDSYLEDEGTVFSDEDIFRQVYFLATASTETSALSVCFILLQLGMYPDIQENVYREIIELLGPDKEISVQDLNKLKYTEQVILETLRIYTVLPLLGRQATTNIQIGEKIIPKGTNIIVSPYMVHRNEKYWPDCEVFNPERFNDTQSKNIEPGSFIPFFIGARDCVGRYYGMTMMKVFLTNIVRKFHIVARNQSVEDMKLSFYISMKPTSDINLKFIQRVEN